MPQIDQVSFLSIICWTASLYIFQYLLLNTTYFYVYFTSLKLKIFRLIWVYLTLFTLFRLTFVSVNYPWLRIDNSN